MHKHFDGSREIFPDQAIQVIHLLVRLVYIKIPGHGEVAVEVQNNPVLDGAQVVQINPVIRLVRI